MAEDEKKPESRFAADVRAGLRCQHERRWEDPCVSCGRGAGEPAKPSLIDRMMAYENGEMSTDEGDLKDEAVQLFQELIDSGKAWDLQGHYGRTAQRLVTAGLCKMPEKKG